MNARPFIWFVGLSALSILWIFTSSSLASRMSDSSTTVIDHIVLLKVRSDVTADDIQRLVDGVNSLKSIPGVVTITVGSTFVEEWMADRRDGITHSLSCRLASKEALKAYQDHPLHVKVKSECIAPILAAPPVAIDYEATVVQGEG